MRSVASILIWEEIIVWFEVREEERTTGFRGSFGQ